MQVRVMGEEVMGKRRGISKGQSRGADLRAAILARLDVLRELLVGPAGVPKVHQLALSLGQAGCQVLGGFLLALGIPPATLLTPVRHCIA